MKILCLCDSPTLNSGFARVAQNLFKRWARAGATIDVWGIAFMGWGYKDCPYVNQFFPAGRGGEWCQPDPLRVFLRQLQQGGYTHVWIMQDTFLLAQWDFPKALKDVCKSKGIRSMLYFPVDAPLKPEWTDIIAAVDCAVAYTEYGATEARRKSEVRGQQLLAAGPTTELRPPISDLCVLPHGVDTTIYRPISDRAAEREKFWQPVNGKLWVQPDDFLMVNLNSHQRRKDVSRSLEILAELKKLGVPAKLILHMSAISDQDVNLEVVGEQLGLKVFEDWGHHSQLFHLGQGSLPELPTAEQPSSLLQLYNVCDLYLTTTLGEGWGLGITEALACGTPVAMPEHTACAEIGAKLVELGMIDSRVLLPCEPGGMVQELDNSRLRPRVSVPLAARAIKTYYESGLWQQRSGLTQGVRDWLNWDRIAREMLKLLKGKS
jgi:glycosyltransferase involved in cell wall biosynthesis